MEKSVKLTGDETIGMYDYMFVFLGMSLELQEPVSSNTEVEKFSKKYVLLPLHKTCTRCYFIVKGMLKVYQINDKGKEDIIWILKEGDVVTSPESFISQMPSVEVIQAMEATICITLSHQAMVDLRERSTEFKDLYIRLTDFYYQRKCKKEQLLLKDPEERYKQFKEENPDLVDRCTDVDIAAYLHVARETISRLKNK